MWEGMRPEAEKTLVKFGSGGSMNALTAVIVL